MEQLDCADHAEFQGSTLVVAVPSVGNTGQMAADLLVSAYQPARVAMLESVNVLPVAGHNPYHAEHNARSQACSCLDVYQSPVSPHLCFLQQRGPVSVGRQRAFARELADWVASAGFARVLLLASMDSTLMDDRAIQHGNLVLVTPDDPCDAWSGPSLGELEGVQAESVASMGAPPTTERRAPPWPTFHAISSVVPCAVLMTFSADGNNLPEAVSLANGALQLLPGQPPGADGTARTIGPSCFPPSWAPLLTSQA